MEEQQQPKITPPQSPKTHTYACTWHSLLNPHERVHISNHLLSASNTTTCPLDCYSPAPTPAPSALRTERCFSNVNPVILLQAIRQGLHPPEQTEISSLWFTDPTQPCCPSAIPLILHRDPSHANKDFPLRVQDGVGASVVTGLLGPLNATPVTR